MRIDKTIKTSRDRSIRIMEKRNNKYYGFCVQTGDELQWDINGTNAVEKKYKYNFDPLLLEDAPKENSISEDIVFFYGEIKKGYEDAGIQITVNEAADKAFELVKIKMGKMV